MIFIYAMKKDVFQLEPDNYVKEKKIIKLYFWSLNTDSLQQ